MPYTLAELKSRVLRHLGRPSDDDTIGDDNLAQSINVSRAEAWRLCGGPVADIMSIDIVAGQRDYSVASYRQAYYGIASVAAKDSNGQMHQLRRVSIPEIVNYYKTDDEQDDPEVWAYIDVPLSQIGFLEEIPWKVLGAGGPCIAVYPVPDTAVSDGLSVEIATAARALDEDDQVSSLPTPVDEAACWSAACEIGFSDLFDDPGVSARLPSLESKARLALNRARWAVNNLQGGQVQLQPVDNFGTRTSYLTDTRWPSVYDQTDELTRLG